MPEVGPDKDVFAKSRKLGELNGEVFTPLEAGKSKRTFLQNAAPEREDPEYVAERADVRKQERRNQAKADFKGSVNRGIASTIYNVDDNGNPIVRGLKTLFGSAADRATNRNQDDADIARQRKYNEDNKTMQVDNMFHQGYVQEQSLVIQSNIALGPGDAERILRDPRYGAEHYWRLSRDNDGAITKQQLIDSIPSLATMNDSGFRKMRQAAVEYAQDKNEETLSRMSQEKISEFRRWNDEDEAVHQYKMNQIDRAKEMQQTQQPAVRKKTPLEIIEENRLKQEADRKQQQEQVKSGNKSSFAEPDDAVTPQQNSVIPQIDHGVKDKAIASVSAVAKNMVVDTPAVATAAPQQSVESAQEVMAPVKNSADFAIADTGPKIDFTPLSNGAMMKKLGIGVKIG